MKSITTLLLVILSCLNAYSSTFHVSCQSGSDLNPGSIEQPFRTIMAAVKVAFPGDTITVHGGIYREWVNPLRGGTDELNRIVYRAAEGEKVEIKGSERISSWVHVKNGTWKVELPNSFFGDYNPYKEILFGDWIETNGKLLHTGEVYMNDKSFYEVDSLSKVFSPSIIRSKMDPQGSESVWYCESDDYKTVIYANFGRLNPNKEYTEIAVRPTCFYPLKQGIDYITLSGFYISQAATQWGAPTAEQIGMVATHWNKKWIIENNIIYNTKCAGITLGKEYASGHNMWSCQKEKDGAFHYIEAIFHASRLGWNKQNVGSHIVRRNVIFNCEQAGICGSLGAIFSQVSDNHIYNIHVKDQFWGYEIAGIKFHAAIDALLEHNRIHDCTFGIWLDWMTQGTRVTRNLIYANSQEDIFTEANHGPYLVDNNILLSERGISSVSDGGAFVYNLITGTISTKADWRYTPYFLPHSTEISGYAPLSGGDDRYYNNIFVSRRTDANNQEQHYGLAAYNQIEMPIYAGGNVYYGEGSMYKGEEKFSFCSNQLAEVTLREEGERVFICLHNFTGGFGKGDIIDSYKLGRLKTSGYIFDDPAGNILEIKSDYFSVERKDVCAGPFAILQSDNEIQVW